jgi:Gas vesicle synthesis protein GvpL/GvpF
MEWSVKAFAPPRPPVPSAPRPADESRADESTSSGGMAYLQRKKAENEARLTGEERALEVADAVHAALSGLSAASRRLPAQDPRLTGHEGTMVLNGAYLVEIEEGAAFQAEVSALQAGHPDAGIDLRGPWPPYSFAMLEQR